MTNCYELVQTSNIILLFYLYICLKYINSNWSNQVMIEYKINCLNMLIDLQIDTIMASNYDDT